MGSLRQFWAALEAFFGSLASVTWPLVAIALVTHLANLALRTIAWRNVLADALPGHRVRWFPVAGSYMAGVGLNGVLPARAGDLTKVFLVQRKVEGAPVPTIAATLVVETLVDIPLAFLLLVWAFAAGHLPSLPALPGLSAFEWSFLASHPTETLIGLVVVAFLVTAAIILMGHRIRRFWERVADGFTILRTPRRYARRVAAYQVAGWVLRVITAVLFLKAFGIPATLTNALLVLVVQGAATSLPLTPGGIGPKQALTVVILGGVAARSDLLAFSVGMEMSVLVVNLALGVASMILLLGGFRIREALTAARAPAPPGD